MLLKWISLFFPLMTMRKVKMPHMACTVFLLDRAMVPGLVSSFLYYDKPVPTSEALFVLVFTWMTLFPCLLWLTAVHFSEFCLDSSSKVRPGECIYVFNLQPG